jgi:hypothetical protein
MTNEEVDQYQPAVRLELARAKRIEHFEKGE